jgi:hypothetical protein
MALEVTEKLNTESTANSAKEDRGLMGWSSDLLELASYCFDQLIHPTQSLSDRTRRECEEIKSESQLVQDEVKTTEERPLDPKTLEFDNLVHEVREEGAKKSKEMTGIAGMSDAALRANAKVLASNSMPEYMKVTEAIPQLIPPTEEGRRIGFLVDDIKNAMRAIEPAKKAAELTQKQYRDPEHKNIVVAYDKTLLRALEKIDSKLMPQVVAEYKNKTGNELLADVSMLASEKNKPVLEALVQGKNDSV